MLGTLSESHTTVICNDAGQKHFWINSILFDNNQNHSRNFNRSLWMLIAPAQTLTLTPIAARVPARTQNTVPIAAPAPA